MEVSHRNRFLDGGREALRKKGAISNGDAPFDELNRRWYEIVEQYSHKKLSFWEDRLDALSGFAAEWGAIKPNDEYMAGLWKSDLFRGLAWFPAQSRDQIRRRLPQSDALWPSAPSFPGIPSWSWAAYNGAVAHFGEEWFRGGDEWDFTRRPGVGTVYYHTPCSLELISVWANVPGQNAFGRVIGGQLVLTNWSLQITIDESNHGPGRFIAVGDAPKAYKMHPDLRYTNDGMVYFDNDPFALAATDLLLLQLGRGRNLHHSSSFAVGLALLAVVPGENETECTQKYIRVGMFDTSDAYFWARNRKRRTVTII